jgi:parvulin-like peptidyl-prolyl isomerase
MSQLNPRKLPEAEVKAYYDAHPELFRAATRVRLKQILIMAPPGSPSYDRGEQQQRAVFVQRAAAADPSKFDALQDEYDEDPIERGDGGEVGWVDSEMSRAKLFEPTFKLEPGQVSDVVESEVGFHVFKVLEKEEGVLRSFAEAEQKARHLLYKEKEAKLQEELLEKYRREAGLQ